MHPQRRPMKIKRRYNQFAALPTLNLEEFEALTDLLYEAVGGNRSAICRILGIDRRTWDKWITEPPTWPWWNVVLRLAIKHMMIGMHGRRGSPAAKHVAYVRDALARIPNNTELVDEITLQAWQFSAAEEHLRKLLAPGPLAWDRIKLVANSGGFTPRQLRLAANSLGIVKDREFGGSSMWSLPEVGED